MAGLEEIQLPSGDIFTWVQAAFTLSGLKAMGILLLIAGGFTAYFKFSDRFGGSGQDPRGFTVSKEGTYGTASWMGERELKDVLEVQPLTKADGTSWASATGKQCASPRTPDSTGTLRCSGPPAQVSLGDSSVRPCSTSSSVGSRPSSRTAKGSCTRTPRSCSANTGMR